MRDIYNMTIDDAISIVAYSKSGEYNLYFYVLDDPERIKEIDKLYKARKVLKKNNIGNECVAKHIERQKNKIPEPVRFIDRIHLKAVDTDELPF